VASNYEIARYINRAGTPLNHGSFDIDFADAGLGTDATGMDAGAEYGFQMGSGALLKDFSSSVSSMLGHQAQRFGGSPMQIAGTYNAGMGPVWGGGMMVGGPVGAPRFLPPHIVGVAQTPNGSTSSVHITAGSKPEFADPQFDDGLTDEEVKEGQSEEAKEARLDKAVDSARDNVPEGFEPADWERIVDDAKAAALRRSEAEDTDADKEFKHIMRELPRPRGEGDAETQKFVRDLGQWRAEHINGINDSAEYTRLVDDIAGADGKPFTLRLDDSRKAKRLEKRQNVRTFKVEGESEEHGLHNGETVYYITTDDGRSIWTRSLRDKSGIVSGLAVDGARDEITLGGSTDYLEVSRVKLLEGPETQDGHRPLYTQYKLGASSGEVSSAIRQQQSYLYLDGQGNWYRKDGDEYVPIAGEPELVAGRLYFNDAGVATDGGHADDVGEYMTAVDEASDALAARREAGEDFATERVERVERAFDEALGDDANKIKFSYDAEAGAVNIDCKPEDRNAVLEALEIGASKDAGDVTEEENGRRYLFNDVMKDLPAGAEVMLNGEEIALGDNPIVPFLNEMRDTGYKTVRLSTGSPIDVSEMRYDQIVNELDGRVSAAIDSAEAEHVGEIVIEDQVVFPESFKISDEDVVLEAEKVRQIAREVSKRHDKTVVRFKDARLDGQTGSDDIRFEVSDQYTEDQSDAPAEQAAAPATPEAPAEPEAPAAPAPAASAPAPAPAAQPAPPPEAPAAPTPPAPASQPPAPAAAPAPTPAAQPSPPPAPPPAAPAPAPSGPLRQDGYALPAGTNPINADSH